MISVNMKKYFLFVCLWLQGSLIFAQNVKIRGIVKNAADSTIQIYNNSFDHITRSRNGTRYKATIAKNGEFEVSVPEKSINQWALEVGGNVALLYLCVNHDLNLTVDFKNENAAVSASGPNAAEVNFLNTLSQKVKEKYGDDFYNRLAKLGPKESLALRKEKAAFELATLDEYIKTHPVSNKYYQWLKTLSKYEPYERTLVESLSPQMRQDSNMVALLTANGLDDDNAAKNSNEYNDLIDFYAHYRFNGGKYPFTNTDYFEFGLKSTLKGLTKQVFVTRQMLNFTGSSDSTYQSAHAKFLSAVQDPQLRQIVIDYRKAHLNKLAESNRSKENISQSASLNEIFQKYKGKIIYVDFWASWCGPCRSEMPNADALKNKLAGNDVVFLYLGYQDQKLNWLAARKELQIKGEHYLLSTALIKEANAIFQITGIPHHAIIDKDGTILDKKAARPSEVYDQLLKLAIKK
jgi:thiol-disulfide isomerase/thioredoxin